MSEGAAMLYLATNTSQYLTDAEAYFRRGPAWGQSWGNKFTGCMVIVLFEFNSRSFGSENGDKGLHDLTSM